MMSVMLSASEERDYCPQPTIGILQAKNLTDLKYSKWKIKSINQALLQQKSEIKKNCAKEITSFFRGGLFQFLTIIDHSVLSPSLTGLLKIYWLFLVVLLVHVVPVVQFGQVISQWKCLACWFWSSQLRPWCYKDCWNWSCGVILCGQKC